MMQLQKNWRSFFVKRDDRMEFILSIFTPLLSAALIGFSLMLWKVSLVRAVLRDLAKDLQLLEFRIPEYKQTTEMIDEFQHRIV